MEEQIKIELLQETILLLQSQEIRSQANISTITRKNKDLMACLKLLRKENKELYKQLSEVDTELAKATKHFDE